MRRTRFSLYCLEDGDEYFGDYIAELLVHSRSRMISQSVSTKMPLKKGGLQQNLQRIRGKVRLAGRALFFDPDDWSKPIYTFKLKDIVRKTEGELSLVREEEALSRLGLATGGGPSGEKTCDHLVFDCDVAYTQQINGEIHPYGVETFSVPQIFSFPFGKEEELVSQLNALLVVERVAACRCVKRAEILCGILEEIEKRNAFALTWLKSPSESIVAQTLCARICPLTLQRGRLVITTERLYFRPTFPISSNLDDISLRDIRRVERRQLQFKEIGLEIATVDDQLLLFQFSNSKDRDELFATLGRHPKLERLSVNSIELMQHRWVTGNLSTFDYLMFLNWSAGRSMNDLAQYPVIPWVLSDYTSKTIDLNDFSVYRDLSKPIGALNPSRLIQFKQRAEELRTMGEDPYLYGSHFSNPAYVAFFKVRTHPQFMLVLQGGRLDTGSRIFDSISECWSSVMTGPTDLKELMDRPADQLRNIR